MPISSTHNSHAIGHDFVAAGNSRFMITLWAVNYQQPRRPISAHVARAIR